MQSVLSRIWTRVTVSISYDDKHYTMGTLLLLLLLTAAATTITTTAWTTFDNGLTESVHIGIIFVTLFFIVYSSTVLTFAGYTHNKKKIDVPSHSVLQGSVRIALKIPVSVNCLVDCIVDCIVMVNL